jgi:hypothetical protein
LAAKARATFPARIAAAAICAAVVARGFAGGAPNHRASSRVLCRNRGESAVFFCMISTFLDFPETVSPATLTLHDDSALQGGYHPISAAVDRAGFDSGTPQHWHPLVSAETRDSISFGKAFFHSPPVIRPLLRAVGLRSQRKVHCHHVCKHWQKVGWLAGKLLVIFTLKTPRSCAILNDRPAIFSRYH